MPNMNEISHGLAFINDKYDGYIASFISVNYCTKISNNSIKKILPYCKQLQRFLTFVTIKLNVLNRLCKGGNLCVI